MTWSGVLCFSGLLQLCKTKKQNKNKTKQKKKKKKERKKENLPAGATPERSGAPEKSV